MMIEEQIGQEINSGLKNWGPPRNDLLDFSLDTCYKLVSFLLFGWCLLFSRGRPCWHRGLAGGHVVRITARAWLLFVIWVRQVRFWKDLIGQCELTSGVSNLVGCATLDLLSRAGAYARNRHIATDKLNLRGEVRNRQFFLVSQSELYGSTVVLGSCVVVDNISID